jgi:hypothetical protein
VTVIHECAEESEIPLVQSSDCLDDARDLLHDMLGTAIQQLVSDRRRETFNNALRETQVETDL